MEIFQNISPNSPLCCYPPHNYHLKFTNSFIFLTFTKFFFYQNLDLKMHMHMSFWWGTDIGDLLIKGFTINGVSAVIYLCISLFILSILSEALKVSK